MAKYLLLYRSPTDAPRPAAAPSPAQMQEAMAKWMSWKEKFQSEIVDMGDKLLSAGGAVCRSSGVTDGPYIEGKEVIGGYMIVEAPSLAVAVQIAQEGPMLMQPDASIEIRELAGMPKKMG